MKNIVLLVGVLIVCVESQHYDTGKPQDSPADKIKDHPGKCFEENVGLIDKGAEVKVKGKCQTVLCLDGGKYQVKKCTHLEVEHPCYAVYPDTTFPECCNFKIECLKQYTPVPPYRPVPINEEN